MGKLLRLAIIAFIIIVGVYGITGIINSSKPPSPIIKYGNIKIPAEQGSYCWRGINSAKCVDMISPPGIIAHHNMTPTVVSPEATLIIDFKNPPKPETLGANIWIGEEAESANINGNKLKVPKEKGVYIYDIHANWDKGSSGFVFVIEIQ